MTTMKHEYDGWSYERLRQQRNRAHFLLEDPYRYVSVILSTRPNEPKRLFCIDSPCYHGAGPLAEGDVVEMESMLCLRCPWHHYLVNLESGCEVRMEVEQDGKHMSAIATYPLRPLAEGSGQVTIHRGPEVQRRHRATLDETTGILTIEVESCEVMRAKPLRSDAPSESVQRGGMCMQIADIKSKGLDAM